MKTGKLSLFFLPTLIEFPFSNLVELDLCIFILIKLQIDSEINP